MGFAKRRMPLAVLMISLLVQLGQAAATPTSSPTTSTPSSSPTTSTPSSSPTTTVPSSSPTTSTPSISPSPPPTSWNPTKSPSTGPPVFGATGTNIVQAQYRVQLTIAQRQLMCTQHSPYYNSFASAFARSVSVTSTMVTLGQIDLTNGEAVCTPSTGRKRDRDLEETTTTQYDVTFVISQLTNSGLASVTAVLASPTSQASGLAAMVSSMTDDGFTIIIVSAGSVTVIAPPTGKPSMGPTGKPTSKPSAHPTNKPSLHPSKNPHHSPTPPPTPITQNPSPLPSHRPSPPPSPPPTGPTPPPQSSSPTPPPVSSSPTPPPTPPPTTTMSPTPPPVSMEPTVRAQVYTVSLSVKLAASDTSRKQEMCDNLASTVSGTTLRCHLDVGTKKAQMNMQVGSRDAAISLRNDAATYIETARQIPETHIQAHYQNDAAAYVDGILIEITTTQPPSVDMFLMENIGKHASLIADDMNALNLLCSDNALGAINTGIESYYKYESRHTQYLEWHMDTFKRAADIQDIPAQVAIHAFREAQNAGEAAVQNACNEIGALVTLEQMDDVNGEMNKIVEAASPDIPAVTVWSTLYNKEDHSNVVAIIHAKMVFADTLVPKEVFTHFCSDGSQDQLNDFLAKYAMHQKNIDYFNALQLEGYGLVHTHGENVDTLMALAQISEEDNKNLCKLGRDRYDMDEQMVLENYWHDLHIEPELTSLNYVVASLANAGEFTAEQVMFLLNADGMMISAYAGENYDSANEACQSVKDMMPMDIWNHEGVSMWYTHQTTLRHSMNTCYNQQFDAAGDKKRHLAHSKEEMEDRAMAKKKEEEMEDTGSFVCNRLNAESLHGNDMVTLQEVMLAVHTCKDDLIAAVEMMENHYDDHDHSDEIFDYFTEKIGKPSANGGKFEIGVLAYWDNDQKQRTSKWHPVIEQIYVQGIRQMYEPQAKFCDLMAGADKDLVSVLNGDDVMDMGAMSKKVQEVYKSVAPSSKSGYLQVQEKDAMMHISPIESFYLRVSTKGAQTDAMKEEILMHIQQQVDMGTADMFKYTSHNEAMVLYDIEESKLAIHAEDIAQLMKDGITLKNGDKLKVHSAEIVHSYKEAQAALEDAGAKVTHIQAKCFIETATGMLVEMMDDMQQEEEEEMVETTTEAAATEAPAAATEAPAATDPPAPAATDPPAPPAPLAQTSSAFAYAMSAFALVIGALAY